MGIFATISKMREEHRKDVQAAAKAKDVYRQAARDERIKEAKNAAVRDVRNEYKQGFSPKSGFGGKLLKGVKEHLASVRERNMREEKAFGHQKPKRYSGMNTPPMLR